MDIIKSASFLALVFLFTSCSVSKHLKKGELVHAETNIELTSPEIISKKRKVATQLYALDQPKPAKGITKWQTGLYNKNSKKAKRDSTGKAKGIRGWVMRTIGKPPVFFDARKVNQTRLSFKKYFFDNGYFGTKITVDTTVIEKEVTVNYHVFPKEQYFIRNIHLPDDSLKLVKDILNPEEKSRLNINEPYSQTELTAERERLTKLANNLGYLNVSKDHFYFFIDTALGSHKVDIYLQIRQPKDSTIYQAYHLNKNVVFATYILSKNKSGSDTTNINGFEIIQKNDIIKPKVLANIINGETGELYSIKKQNNALTRLLDLGVYKFVNLKIDQEITDSSYLFNRNYFLTPDLMQDVTTEFEANTRSTSYFGLAAAVTYSHKNIFRGAERIDVRLSGGFGTQPNNIEDFINTLDGAFNVTLTLPRLIVPFRLKRNISAFVPKTLINFGNNYQERREYYAVNTFTLSYGYRWSKAKKRNHVFYPINISQFLVKHITEAMQELFDENPRLESSFQDVFIVGLFYNYVISTQTTNVNLPYFYMRTGFETSGNMAYLLINNLGNQQQRPYEILGVPFSQFVRLDGDFRYHVPLKNSAFVSRFIAGIGIPYGNSNVLPYIKQFFIGGPSSIRAFEFRTLGPGSFAPETPEDQTFIEQTGDMKLELNFEYRFPMTKFLKGATFIDMGNIWLLEGTENDTREGVFNINTFYKEIAVGTGFGIRLDLKVIVIRMDGAFPLRVPSRDLGDRWVISDINFFNYNWRKDNIRWNFAVGYPF